MSTSRPTLTKYDENEHYRCPQLGEPVKFSYCRRMNEGLPCRKLHPCWEGKIDVETYLHENFTPDEIYKAFHQSVPGRVGTIFDVLNRVLEEKEQNKNTN